MRTLVELLSESSRRFPTLPATRLHGVPELDWTYPELADWSRRFATFLRNRDVGKGDRVVLWAPNRPEWVAAFFGIQLVGAIAVPLDVRSREDLLTRIESQTQPKLMVVGQDQADQLTAPHAPHVLVEHLTDTLAEVKPQAIDESIVAPEDIAEIVFTSGTTGNPKGVILTHRNIISNVFMAHSATLPTPHYQVLSILPLSHLFEQTGNLLVPLSGGASVTYVRSLRPDVIFAAMAEHRNTNMACVPQVLHLFRAGIEREIRKQKRERTFARMHHAARWVPFPLRRYVFRSIHRRFGGSFEFVHSGGAYLDPDLASWWERLGIKVVQGYGMTEAAPIVATNTLTSRDYTSVGRPLRGVELRFAEDREILVRGDNITPGYWQDPEGTAASFTDGWYRTGDLGYLDEGGCLHIHGRKKNIIVLANGLNVYPEDIEAALAREPGVRSSVVLGLGKPHDLAVHAVLLLDAGATPETIVRSANAQLAPQQQIRGSTVWPDKEFPMTPTLKIKRADVQERITAMQAAERRPAAPVG